MEEVLGYHKFKGITSRRRAGRSMAHYEINETERKSPTLVDSYRNHQKNGNNGKLYRKIIFDKEELKLTVRDVPTRFVQDYVCNQTSLTERQSVIDDSNEFNYLLHTYEEIENRQKGINKTLVKKEEEKTILLTILERHYQQCVGKGRNLPKNLNKDTQTRLMDVYLVALYFQKLHPTLRGFRFLDNFKKRYKSAYDKAGEKLDYYWDQQKERSGTKSSSERMVED